MNNRINPIKSSSIVGHHTTCNVKTKHNYPPLYQSRYIYCRNPSHPCLCFSISHNHEFLEQTLCTNLPTPLHIPQLPRLHRSISFNPKCHNHLPKMFSLKVINFFSPNPPLAIGVQTVSYPTKCSFKIINQSKHLTFYYIEKCGTTMASSQKRPS